MTAIGRALLVLVTALLPRLAAADRLDVALVLAVDISLSMDREEQAAQRQGYVEAIRHPAFHDAVRRGEHGRIALAYVEWGAPWDQRTTLDWTIIDSAQAAERFAARLAAAPVVTSRGTSISGAIDHAIALLEQAPSADRRVLDISGDGPNNMGDPVLEARGRAMAAGIEINGLPLMLKEHDAIFSIPDLDIYYETCVITGPAAFVLPVTDVRQFTGAIRQKLILELAQAAPVPGLQARSGSDCLIGEKLYNRWRRSFGAD
jgi:hypothetical protein